MSDLFKRCQIGKSTNYKNKIIVLKLTGLAVSKNIEDFVHFIVEIGLLIFLVSVHLSMWQTTLS